MFSFQNYGMNKYSNETRDNIDFNGMLECDQVQVTGATKVNGFLKIFKSTLHRLDVQGNFESRDSTIEEDATISGTMTATKSIFKKRINIMTKSFTLSNTKTKSILVKPSSGGSSLEVHLNDKTEVDGDITFERIEGIVHLNGGSRISGRVIGGVIKDSSNDGKEGKVEQKAEGKGDSKQS